MKNREFKFLKLFRYNQILLLTLAAIVFSPLSFALDDISSVTNLLKRMADANRQLSYEGVFSYEHGGALKTVKVFHSVREGQEIERIVHLNGPEKEVIRRGNDLNCQRLGDAMLKGTIQGLSNLSSGYLGQYYTLRMRDDERVAGRNTRTVHLIPKDVYRYGYVLGIDKKTGLLLQSMLIGSDNRVLERFQFVDIAIGPFVDDRVLEPTNAKHHSASVDGSPCLDVVGSFSAPSQHNLTPSWLPPGFALSGYKASEQMKRETFVYTDGLAVFSVFVDSDNTISIPDIQAQRGATVAYLTRMQQKGREYTICVVGEIPATTAKQVAESLMPNQ